MAGGAGIDSTKDARSGELGTTIPGKETIAHFDLGTGDTLYYEYQTNSPCWFIITTDWFDLDAGGKLNLSETHATGVFECPEDGLYILIVFFLDFPGGFEATVDYDFYTLDDPSRTILITKPILLTVLTVVLISMLWITYRRTHTASSDGRPKATGSYWDYFASEIGNWIAIDVGACLLVATSVLDLADLTIDVPESLREWLFDFGFYFLVFGLFFGLAITWPKYNKGAIQRAQRKD